MSSLGRIFRVLCLSWSCLSLLGWCDYAARISVRSRTAMIRRPQKNCCVSIVCAAWFKSLAVSVWPSLFKSAARFFRCAMFVMVVSFLLGFRYAQEYLRPMF
jgi:hypothetical protein